jgi:hypothetical protein
MNYEISIAANTTTDAVREARRRLSSSAMSGCGAPGPVVLVDGGGGNYHTVILDASIWDASAEVTDGDILSAGPAGTVAVVSV